MLPSLIRDLFAVRAHLRRRLDRTALAAVLVTAALLAAAPTAQAAQTYNGSLTLATFNRVTTFCSASVKRTYNVFNFSFNASSSTTYTLTVTRTSGSGLGLDLYQGSFDPTQPCTNYWGGPGSATTGGSSASVSVTLGYSSQFALVVSGNSTTDTGGFTISVTSSNGTSVTPVCSGSILSPSSFPNVPAAGGPYTTTFSPSLGCGGWTSNAASTSWISGIPASGSGSATINFNVAANTGGARSANISIGSQTLSVSQAAASCAYTLPQSSASVAASGGPQTLNVSANISNCAWTASSNDAWITGVTPSGTGNGTVNYTVAANTGSARKGTLTVAGKTFTVNQASGCTVSLPVGSSTVGVSGGSASFNVTTAAGCQYTASSSAPWLTNFASTATGVSFDVAANTGVARMATIDVACNDTASKAAYTLNQDGAIAQPVITQQPAD